MTINVINNMQQVHSAYSYLASASGKKKERFDVILEPLQAVSQLAFLKFCPIGSKISIENNLLFVQLPNWHQGISRAWNKDKREDILLLFNAVQRFNKIYCIHTKDENDKVKQSNIKTKLIQLVSRLAIEGIENLINTYSRADNANIVQTLVMYKNVLKYPERFSDIDEMSQSTMRSGKTMEEVFAQIKNNWTEEEMSLLYWTLQAMEKNPSDYECFINGAISSLIPIQKKIRKWISDNIVY